jgi:Wound-induced protein WI12
LPRLFLNYISNSELANLQFQSETATIEEENHNKVLVIKLYNALNNRDVDTVHRLLMPDLEWRFHGPPHHQHMMSLLTGTSPDDSFLFIPRSICVFGPVVLVEGTDLAGSAYWIHAWTVGPDGVIMQVREYFNTSLTVTRVGDGTKGSSLRSSPVWRSRLSDQARKSLPGLVLAI